MLTGFAKTIYELLESEVDTVDSVGLDLVITDEPTPIQIRPGIMPESYRKAMVEAVKNRPEVELRNPALFDMGVCLSPEPGLNIWISLLEIPDFVAGINSAVADIFAAATLKLKEPPREPPSEPATGP